MKKLSIIVPIYNEEENILPLYKALAKECGILEMRYACELIFVNDGSTDGTEEQIQALRAKHPHLGYIAFSRNFGKEAATSAGLRHATGDAVIMIDADLQHPPVHIHEFLEKWEKGAEVVVGIRAKNEKEGLIKRYGSKLFYAIMNAIGDTEITPNATDFRLLDRKVVEAFNALTERNRMTRGLIDWLGFKREYVHFRAHERNAGQPKYGFLKLVKLALSSFVAYSLFPLKVAGYLGVLITLISGMIGLFILVEDIILGDPLGFSFSNIAMLAVLNIFLVGVVLASLGLIALYIAGIHKEVMNRPLYVISVADIGKEKVERQ